ncbi:hypothetical protein VNO80_06357 [Phaseolus coccineus]|uniref:Uncharacterized protein n=1 Tax=Phaseolus coccineus TaxID=3886 RepID=A0AAN9REF7_PHACN
MVNIRSKDGSIPRLDHGQKEGLETANSDVLESSLLGYTKGFKKAMHQALHFSPTINPDNFDLNKDVVDGYLIND